MIAARGNNNNLVVLFVEFLPPPAFSARFIPFFSLALKSRRSHTPLLFARRRIYFSLLHLGRHHHLLSLVNIICRCAALCNNKWSTQAKDQAIKKPAPRRGRFALGLVGCLPGWLDGWLAAAGERLETERRAKPKPKFYRKS